MANKVLVVEDERAIRDLLEFWLEDAGYEARTASDGIEGLRELCEFRPDLVVADIVMPHMDGFEFCRLARGVCQVPIMIVSGMGNEADVVKGLNLGADDYVVKPVGLDEFLARVAALHRRHATEPDGVSAENRYEDEYLSIDADRHELLVRGSRVDLTPTEFKLLSYLTERSGKTCTTREILDAVWDSSYYSQELVKWHVAGLRKKMDENAGCPQHIVTVRGVGYRYDGALTDPAGTPAIQAGGQS